MEKVTFLTLSSTWLVLIAKVWIQGRKKLSSLSFPRTEKIIFRNIKLESKLPLDSVDIDKVTFLAQSSTWLDLIEKVYIVNKIFCCLRKKKKGLKEAHLVTVSSLSVWQRRIILDHKDRSSLSTLNGFLVIVQTNHAREQTNV